MIMNNFRKPPTSRRDNLRMLKNILEKEKEREREREKKGRRKYRKMNKEKKKNKEKAPTKSSEEDDKLVLPKSSSLPP